MRRRNAALNDSKRSSESDREGEKEKNLLYYQWVQITICTYLLLANICVPVFLLRPPPRLLLLPLPLLLVLIEVVVVDDDDDDEIRERSGRRKIDYYTNF